MLCCLGFFSRVQAAKNERDVPRASKKKDKRDTQTRTRKPPLPSNPPKAGAVHASETKTRHPEAIGVLFGWFAYKIGGPGLAGVSSIYQGRLLFQKGPSLRKKTRHPEAPSNTLPSGARRALNPRPAGKEPSGENRGAANPPGEKGPWVCFRGPWAPKKWVVFLLVSVRNQPKRGSFPPKRETQKGLHPKKKGGFPPKRETQNGLHPSFRPNWHPSF